MITPEQIAAPGTEHAHQAALFCWAALPETLAKYPELALMFAIPNGGERNKVTAARLKAEGVKAGVPDIFLPVPRRKNHGLFIEMKKEGGEPSKAQSYWRRELNLQGYAAFTCYGWLAARSLVATYLSGCLVA